jgi:transposase
MNCGQAQIDVQRLIAENEALRAANRQLEVTAQEKAEAVARLHKQVEELMVEKAWLHRQLFGRKRETIDPNQLLLFGEDKVQEPPPPAHAAEAPDDEADAMPPKERKRRRVRTRPNVPVERQEITLPEPDRLCRCCNQVMDPIGEEVSEVLDYQPARWVRKQSARIKYACKKCQVGVAVALAPERPIDKGQPGPGLLAHVLTSKYADHLPLNRLEGIFARDGVEISRSTMCDWVAAGAELLKPIVRELTRSVLHSHVVQSDDTQVLVLDRHAKGGSHRSFLWVYLGDQGDVVFDFTKTRCSDGPENFLRGYQGKLQADAYQGYDGVYRRGVTEVGCMAHGRRGLFEAAEKGSEVALHGLALIRMLYRVERQATDAGLTPEQRGALRQRESRPILDMLRTWLDEQQRIALPKSPLGLGWATSSTSGSRSLDSSMTAAWRSTTTRPSARFGRWPWAGRTGSSLGPTKAASAPQRSTR